MGGDKIQTRGCEIRGRIDFNSEGGVVCGVSLRQRMEGVGGKWFWRGIYMKG